MLKEPRKSSLGIRFLGIHGVFCRRQSGGLIIRSWTHNLCLMSGFYPTGLDKHSTFSTHFYLEIVDNQLSF